MGTLIRFHFQCAKGHELGRSIHFVNVPSPTAIESADHVLGVIRGEGTCTTPVTRRDAVEPCGEPIGYRITEGETENPRPARHVITRECVKGHKHETTMSGLTDDEAGEYAAQLHGTTCGVCSSAHVVTVTRQ